MDDTQKQATLSAVRSLIITIGGIAATHGYLSSGTVTEIAGLVLVVGPLVWGIWDKYNAAKKTAVKEVAAVNAGVAVAATGQVGDTVRSVDVPAIIEKFAPVPPVPPIPPAPPAV